ncbi:MAG: shikimate dehydrogenase family protein [Acidimicrobiales bacterium]
MSPAAEGREPRVRARAIAPSGTTRLAGVIGDPVRHSLSPRLHNAAYQGLGLDWIYAAFEVRPDDLAAAIEGARALGMVGLSVTMPHKEAVAKLATKRSALVRRLGAANTITFYGREVMADSTDGAGFLADLRDWASFDPAGKRCGILGAGGAARSIVAALADAGAREILVVNRTAATAYRAAQLAPAGVGRVAKAEEIYDADLVVNATPVGMRPFERRPVRGRPPRPGILPARPDLSDPPAEPDQPLVDGSKFGPGQVVMDLVYDPLVTEWRMQAASNGAETANGLGMLVHQAAAQIEIWSGSRPSVEEMKRAVRLGVPPGVH